MRILIADDHGLFRDGVRLLIEQGSTHTVVAQAEDGLAAVRACAEVCPDLVIMDVRMPVLDGVAAARQMAKLDPPPRIVALAGDADPDGVREMLAAGAAAYVVKMDLARDLLQAIELVLAGRTYLSPHVAGMVVDLAVGNAGGGRVSPAHRISARERDVLKRIAEGESTKEIASNLGVSVKTVETQRKQLMVKLGIFSVAGLTRYAIREGLVVP